MTRRNTEDIKPFNGGAVTPTQELQVLREKDRLRLTGLSRVQWWRLEKGGQVPRRIVLGANSVGWLKHEVENWIRAKAAGRSPGLVPTAQIPILPRKGDRNG